MSTINLDIHGRNYALQCEDGEEADLQMLAQDLSERLTQLDTAFGERSETMTSENTRLVITALMMLAELRDARHFARRRNAQDKEEVQEVIADTLERIAGKLENLAG